MSSLLCALRLVAFFVLSLFGHTIQAADLSTRHPPKGELKVRLDYGLATQSKSPIEQMHKWVYSSYLVFNEPVSSITDGQLKMMAINAYREMEAEILQYKPRRPPRGSKPAILPGVITIMAFDDKIILSSSQKGNTGFISAWPDSPVSLSLDRCSALWKESVLADPTNNAEPIQEHRTGAKCGEVTAFHQYYMTHDQPISDLSPKARVTTVFKFRKDTYRVIPPCGTDREGKASKEEWGCNLLVPDQNVDYLGDIEEEQYELGKIAGGVMKFGQISMCTENRILWDAA
ncbi:hypothetical protein HG530_008354 [Fusarium avenaceum]|nr:hypothetical protein HG530_008354 [Fusarium avenaceum]